jgi:dipeptide/tripeptide permease
MSKRAQRRSPFTATFYVANVMEIFERLAWYGFFAVASLYMTGDPAKGCLGFTDEQQGMMQGVVTFILYLLPVITGGLADRYGFRSMFTVSYLILIPAYFLLGQVTSYGAFFAVFLLVALGAAIFKPLVVGTVARECDETNSSLGFGVFYWMVNVGGFLGPMVAAVVRGWGWIWVFAFSSGYVVFNLVWLFLFYRETSTEAQREQARPLRRVLSDTVTVIGNFRLFLLIFGIIIVLLAAGNEWLSWTQVGVVILVWAAVNVIYDLVVRDRFRGSRFGWLLDRMRLGDWRMGLFLLIVSGFWTSFNQIWFTMPKYIRDHVDTGPLVDLVAGNATLVSWFTEEGQLKPEILVNIDAGSIILFQILVSWAVQRMNAFAAMIAGVLLGAAGLGAAALAEVDPAMSVWIVSLGIFVFSFGEMSAAPTSQDYIGRIAPRGREGLYMGYYFVAMALGNLFGGVLAGPVYGALTRDLGRPDLFWSVSGAVGVVTALALLAFNLLVVARGERT